MEEEAPELLELVSPRISFSHDLASFAASAPAPSRRSDDASRDGDSSSRLPEPDFDFANANAAADDDVAPADRLFAGGRLLPMPPLPPAPKPGPCKQQQPCGIEGGVGGRANDKAAQQACQQRRLAAGSWAPPLFSRSSSVNSATTAGAPRSAGRFGCPTFPLMRSWSAGSAAVARDDGLVVGHHGAASSSSDAAGHRPHRQYYSKLFGGAAAASSSGGGSSRAYYYGGGRKGSSGRHGGVRVSPVLNVPFIGTSVANVLSYLLCDCSHKTKKSREF